MNVKVLLACGLALVCAIIGVVSLGGSTVASTSFDQAIRASERAEVYGVLNRDSIRALKGYNLVSFELVEEKTGKRMAVLYDNPGSGLPSNFPAASHARAAGTYDPTQRRFVSDRVLTKCPSKYQEDKLDEATKAAIARWEKGAKVSRAGS